MRTWPVGTKIYICGNHNHHNYTVGRAYVITEIDDDGTFKARDPESGVVGNWLRWEDVDITPPIGWDYVRTVLPPEVADFLAAFEGIENIVLREDVKNRLLKRVANLYDAIVQDARRVRSNGNGKGGKALSSLPTPTALRSAETEEAQTREDDGSGGPGRLQPVDEDTVITEEEARRLAEEETGRPGDPELRPERSVEPLFRAAKPPKVQDDDKSGKKSPPRKPKR